MYSLLSAGVLANDLARHPSGAAVADAVDRVLSLPTDGPWCDVQPAPEAVRARVRAAAVRRSSRGSSVTVLQETLLGDLEDLLDLLRHEGPLPSAPPEVAQVALDAVTAAWAGRQADLADLLVLRRPWSDLVDPVPPALPERPWTSPLRTLLEEVPHRTADAWRRSVRAHRARRGADRWSVAMHEACVALHAEGRVLEVARAQLAASRALRLAGASTGEDAAAHGMVLTAAVQAVCAADLLDTSALRRAWDAGT